MKTNRYRWVVFGIFFAFMLLHQSDKLLIGPLTESTWIVCGIVFALATRFVPKEIDSMHKQLRERASLADIN